MRKLIVAAVVVALLGLSWFLGRGLAVRPTRPPGAGVAEKADIFASSAEKAARPPMSKTTITETAIPQSNAETTKAEDQDAAEIERCKKIDMAHMLSLHAGIMGYLKKYGHYPEQLSQLVPEFVSIDVLTSPRKKRDVANPLFSTEHADPALVKPSYAFEFSNIVYRDGRTFAEIKEVQRSEWGDVVPMLRSFAYEKVINVSYRGDIYETRLNWEWDSATLDLVEKYGWGPGLTEGEMVKVRVLRPDGAPAADAQVWAAGRSYSFDLPNRPFLADNEGWVTIPVGVDIDRTALVLRAESPGFASTFHRSEPGILPEGSALTLAATQRIGGTVVSSDGRAMPNTRLFLQHTSTSGFASRYGSPGMISLSSDSQGRWSAEIHPEEISGLTAVIAEPGGTPFKHAGPGTPISPESARAGNAVVQAVLPQ